MSLTGMQYSDLYNIVGQAQQIGIYDVILPFLLVFTIVFAVLQKTKIFGEDKKNINVVVAAILALLFLQNNYLIFLLQRFLPNVSLFLIIFLMFLLILGVFLGPQTGISGAAITFAFIVSLIAILVAVSTDLMPYGFGSSILDFWYAIDPGTRTLIWVIAIFVVIIWLVTHEKKREGEGGFGKLLDNISSGFKGK